VSKISRTDRIIGVLLLVVLLVLLGVALSRRASGHQSAARSAGPPGTRAAVHSTADQEGTTSTARASTTTSSSTTTTVATSSGAPGTAPVAGPVTAVGDSIMLDIQSDLEADIPGVQVDGLVSRQFETGIGVVQADRAAGTLGRVLVVELGTNGTVTSADFDAMMQAAAGVSRVVFVNVNVPRSWEAEDNAVLAAGVAQYPGVAVLANWNALSADHPEWFTPDQVHLEPAGAQALATLITSYA
jgi:hypothetical protein